jgi:hypothetical protein
LKFLTVLPAILLLALVAACDDEPSDPDVDVTLSEWSIIVEQDSVEEGAINFNVDNEGERTHEFVIVRTDIAVDDLPTGDDGSFDEDAPGVDVKEEIEDIEDGDDTSRSYERDAGKYVFLCNIVEDIDGTETSHFAQGMFAEFEITAKD